MLTAAAHSHLWDQVNGDAATYRAGLQQAIRAEMDALVELDEAEPDTTRLDELTYALCRTRLRATAAG